MQTPPTVSVSPLITWTYASGPSCFMILTAQSNVLLYLWASRPCSATNIHVSFSAQGKILRLKSQHVIQPTCILVLMTSRGVFPNTLAAPATAPNSPVNKGLMALFGSSPLCWNKKLQMTPELPFWFYVFIILLFIHSHTFVPVPQRSHDIEADGLVGALFQHRGCEALIRPLQPCTHTHTHTHTQTHTHTNTHTHTDACT